MTETKELIINELHRRAGICGHCGKKKCAGKASNSVLPDKLLTDDVLAALEAVEEQPPARDVEGLARAMATADGSDWGKLDDETAETYRIMARAAIAHLDGGPRT